MSKRLFLPILVVMLATLVYGEGPDGARQFRTMLRPELVDANYQCVEIATEGSYNVAVKGRIELDISNPTASGCGWSKSTCALEGKGVLKVIFPRYSSIDPGTPDISVSAWFLEGEKPGQETITVTLDDAVSFQYHITVWS